MQWVLSDGMYEPWHGTDDILSQRLHALPSLNEGVLGNERVLPSKSLFWALLVRLVPRWRTLVIFHWEYSCIYVRGVIDCSI
jgi:hypothetical protein